VKQVTTMKSSLLKLLFYFEKEEAAMYIYLTKGIIYYSI